MEGIYSSSLIPAGFHPTLITEYETTTSDCPLYARYTIPPAFIVDRFQLAQLHADGRLGSHGSTREITLSIMGERDLEAPSGKTGETVVVLRLTDGETPKGKERESGTVLLPLHMRYQIPVLRRRNERGERMDSLLVEMEEPVLFWTCQESTASPTTKSTGCPISSLPNLTSHFPPTTRLQFLRASSTSLCSPATLSTLSIKIPTGVAADLPFVEISNFLVIWSGLIWVVWTVLSSRRRDRRQESRKERIKGNGEDDKND